MYAIGMVRVVGSYLVASMSCDGDIDVVVAASLMTESWTRTFRVLSDVFPQSGNLPLLRHCLIGFPSPNR